MVIVSLRSRRRYVRPWSRGHFTLSERQQKDVGYHDCWLLHTSLIICRFHTHWQVHDTFKHMQATFY